jgi:hypothetical protein
MFFAFIKKASRQAEGVSRDKKHYDIFTISTIKLRKESYSDAAFIITTMRG